MTPTQYGKLIDAISRSPYFQNVPPPGMKVMREYREKVTSVVSLAPHFRRLWEKAAMVAKCWEDPETHLDFAVDDLIQALSDLEAAK